MNLSLNLPTTDTFSQANSLNRKVTTSLNRLIEINNDRCREYSKALKETKDLALKPVFEKYARQSQAFRNTLKIWVKAYGGEVSHELQRTRSLYKIWVDIKSIFPSSDREAILNTCEYIEGMAIDLYKKVLTQTYLPEEAGTELTLQKEELMKAYTEIVSLASLDALYK